MLKRTLGSLLVIGLLASAAFAQAPKMPLPDKLPGDAAPEQVRAEVMAVHVLLCDSVNDVAQVLTKTGALAKAIPVIMDLTGMQPAEIEGIEAAVCRSDVSTLSFEDLRYSNRQAVWLLDIHLTALNQVLSAQ
ncbi:MAG: hypothetical protein ROY82_11335 [Truepera sp.]|nr:hypothetical protein [Truepera sp.]HRN17881.1 hypothetical protein [Trueperaceae bacterium]HRQ09920.1 hypothetical protein [Trueperaceae bacterium]